MIFIETPVFTKRILALVDDETYRKLQEDLTLHPDAGVVIEGTGGVRKIRIAANGHGKEAAPGSSTTISHPPLKLHSCWPMTKHRRKI